jgi:hypothetical protein
MPRTRIPPGRPGQVRGCAAPRDVNIAEILIDAAAAGSEKIAILDRFSRTAVCEDSCINALSVLPGSRMIF